MNLVEKRFSKAAAQYDSHAMVQKKIAEALLSEIPEGFSHAADLGSGPGVNFKELRKKARLVTGIDFSPAMTGIAAGLGIPGTRVITGNIEKIPLPGNSCDLLFSSLAIQWCRMDRVFREIRRISRNNAFIALAFPVSGTLSELGEALRDAGLQNRVISFSDPREIPPILKSSGISGNIGISERIFPERFSSVRDFMDSIRKIGAGTAPKSAPFPRASYRKLLDVLGKMERENRLVHTYRTLFITGHLLKDDHK